MSEAGSYLERYKQDIQSQDASDVEQLSSTKILFYAVGLNRVRCWDLLRKPTYQLLSVADCWKKKGFNYDFRKPQGNWILDSGAFRLIQKWKDFPYTIADYLKFVLKVKPTFFCNMDYPCDGPDHPTDHKHMSNKERVENTITNNIEIREWGRNFDSLFISVIQGYTKEEYLYCIDRLREQGLIQDYMAVGSICIRDCLAEIKAIIQAIRSNLPQRVKLHIFGLALDSVRDLQVRSCINSFDSMAWQYPLKNGRMYVYCPDSSKLKSVSMVRADKDTQGKWQVRSNIIPSQDSYIISYNAYSQYIDQLNKNMSLKQWLEV